MKTFTLEEIAKNKRHFDETCKQSSVQYGGRTYPYYLIPKEVVPPELPNAVMRLTPTHDELRKSDAPEAISLFGVSETVPERFRKFCVLHEIYEFVYVGQGCAGRCARAAEEEISLLMADAALNEGDHNEYLRMRLKFFTDLISYAKKNPKLYTAADIDEFQASFQVFSMAVHGP